MQIRFHTVFLIGSDRDERKSSSQVEYIPRISVREQQMQQIEPYWAKMQSMHLALTSTWIYSHILSMLLQAAVASDERENPDHRATIPVSQVERKENTRREFLSEFFHSQ